MNEVARRYQFVGSHHVPGLAEPWSTPHEHLYTVEVVASGVGRLIIDTDEMDRAWASMAPSTDLDAVYGAENTTVEALAQRWLQTFRESLPMVSRVVVWEDRDRWGSAA